MNRKLKQLLWVGMATALVGATSVLLAKRKKHTAHEKPPKRAPQLKLENPGSQDDFPKPPMESEVG